MGDGDQKMPSSSTTSNEGPSGVYLATKSGLEFIHGSKPKQSVPTTPEDFLVRFREDFEMRVLERPSDMHLVLEMIHVDVSFVNALRRILLAEVPTVALEHVYMWKNSGLLHDEVLSHRLGLIPLDIDARLIDEVDEDVDYENGNFNPTDRNTVVFRLAVSCEGGGRRRRRRGGAGNAGGRYNDDDDDDDDDGGGGGGRSAKEDEAYTSPARRSKDLEDAASDAAASAAKQGYKLHFPKGRPYTKHVYSSDLVWVPQGNQEERFAGITGHDRGIRPVHDDILIAKLRSGQCIELEAHARKGVGKDHAKYSPVSTVSYRLMPRVEILRDVYDELADELVHVYEPGVFELVPTDPGGADPPGTARKARVCNPYACTMSRNFMRHPDLEKSIRITRIPDHFIFSIESVGMHSPEVLLAEAIRVLKQKCAAIAGFVDQTTAMEYENNM